VGPRIEHRESVEGERSLVNFWVNIWFGWIILIASYVYIVCGDASWATVRLKWYIPVALLVGCWLSARGASSAAYVWGVSVKAAFDMQLPELTRKLGYAIPPEPARQRQLWRSLSQTFLQRDPGAYEDAQAFRKPSGTE
jgi:hypothetical protein